MLNLLCFDENSFKWVLHNYFRHAEKANGSVSNVEVYIMGLIYALRCG